MSGDSEIRVPDIGDFAAVEVIEVLVAAGDEVAGEDALITLESDKAALDIPAPAAGRIVRVHVQAGDKVSEGDLIATWEPAAGAATQPVQADPAATAPGHLM